MNYKQYILVLKKYRDVSKGKFGAHCAHASLAASLKEGVTSERFTIWYEGNDQTKILKAVKNLSKLNGMIKKALELGVSASIIPDNGASGEVPKGTVLMGAIGPITEEEAKQLGILKLSNLN